MCGAHTYVNTPLLFHFIYKAGPLINHPELTDTASLTIELSLELESQEDSHTYPAFIGFTHFHGKLFNH